jgi:hypothetical protein
MFLQDRFERIPSFFYCIFFWWSWIFGAAERKAKEEGARIKTLAGAFCPNQLLIVFLVAQNPPAVPAKWAGFLFPSEGISSF